MSKGTVLGGLADILQWGTFTYVGFVITRQDRLKLKTWFDDANKAGRLIRGRWDRKVWLTHTLIARMCRAWLDHHERHGTPCWDLTLSRLMTVAFVSSLGARAGDVALSRGYTSECMRYEDICLRLPRGSTKFEDIQACITIKYEKGKKLERNNNREVYLKPISDFCCCPITLLMIHALRHGLVEGITIEEVLTAASISRDGTIHWRHPFYPVVPAFRHSGSTGVIIHKVSDAKQLDESTKAMGLVANILTKVRFHATRNGYAKDIAHLPGSGQGQGQVTNDVRQAVGHSFTSYSKGLTEAYAGAPDAQYFNAVAERQYQQPFGPKFADTEQVSAYAEVRRPVTEEEYELDCRQNEPGADWKSRTFRKRARERIRNARHHDFLNAAPVEPDRCTLPQLIPTMPSAPSAPYQVDESIDPRLQDGESLEDAVVAAGSHEQLRNAIFLNSEDQANEPSDEIDEEEPEEFALAGFELEQLLSEELTLQQDTSPKARQVFITRFSSINLTTHSTYVRVSCLGRKRGKGQSNISAEELGAGNSRDLLTPFIYHCSVTPGCEATSPSLATVQQHERTCTTQSVMAKIAKGQSIYEHCLPSRLMLTPISILAAEPRSFGCDREGCKFSTTSQKTLIAHQVRHKWIPKPCPHGCEDGKLHNDNSQFCRHMMFHRSDLWPTQCLFPGCPATQSFKTDKPYSSHLREAHGLKEAAARKPYFPKAVHVEKAAGTKRKANGKEGARRKKSKL